MFSPPSIVPPAPKARARLSSSRSSGNTSWRSLAARYMPATWIASTPPRTGVICAPVFSEGEGLATQVKVGLSEGLKNESWILCDSLVSIRKSDLAQYVGTLASPRLAELDRAIIVALDLR